MSKYSEMMGSFLRTGNYPIEAEYIFDSVDELLNWASLPENKVILHEGLFKIVKGDPQSLYWVINNNGVLEFVKLIDKVDIENIKTQLQELLDKLNQEIQDRKDGDTLIWGTEDLTIIPVDYNNIVKIANSLVKYLAKLNNLKTDIKAVVGTEEDDIIAYLQTLDYKNLTEVSEALHHFLNTIDEKNPSINTLPELQEFLRGFEYNHNLYECFVDFWNKIQGEPTPNTQFRTLRGIQDFVQALATSTLNRDHNLQSELDQTQIGVGLSGDGSYNADKQTKYLQDATSVMNALKILDSLIDQAINNCNIEPSESNTTKVEINKGVDKTTISVSVKLSSEIGNDLIEKADGVYHNIDIDYENGILTVYSNGNIKKQLTLGISSIVEDAYYDATSENIILIFKLDSGDSQKVVIPASGLVDELHVDNSIADKVVHLEKQRNTQGPDKLSADVRISQKQDNILEKDGNTLFVGGNADNIRYGEGTVKDKLDSIPDVAVLEEKIKIEEERAKVEEERLETLINKEVTDRTNAVTIETNRAKSVETNLQKQITSNDTDIANLQNSALKMQIVTQDQYNTIVKDSLTCYAILTNNKITKMYIGNYEVDICKLWAKDIETDSSIMYYGYIVDSTISSFDQITTEIVNTNLANNNLVQSDLTTLSKQSIGIVPDGAWIFVALPKNSGYVATIDNGIGEKVSFDIDDAIQEGNPDKILETNGNITLTLNNKDYLIFGEYATISGERIIYID